MENALSSSSLSDPFEPLEMVWTSLECWFELLMTEVQRLQKEEGIDIYEIRKLILEPESVTSILDPLPESVTSIPEPSHGDHVSVASPIGDIKRNADAVDFSDPQSSDEPKTKPKEPNDDDEVREKSPVASKKPPHSLSLAQSSQLAAAIVLSAPLQRRAAYLKSSSSFDETQASDFAETTLKRRSWHVDRVAARYLTVGADNLFTRSLSTEAGSGTSTRTYMFSVVQLCSRNTVCSFYMYLLF